MYQTFFSPRRDLLFRRSRREKASGIQGSIIPDKTESIYDVFYLTVLYWVSKQFVPDFEKKLVDLNSWNNHSFNNYCATQIYVHWISAIIT